MTVHEAFKILGLDEEASSARDVRRAHARLASLYHPEDHPDEYERIREAYEMALAHVRRAKHMPRVSVPVEERYETANAADDKDEREEERYARPQAHDTPVDRELGYDGARQGMHRERAARYDEFAVPDYLRAGLEEDVVLEQEAEAWCDELRAAFEGGLNRPEALTFLHRNDCERFWPVGEAFDEQVWSILHRHVERADRHQLSELFKALKAPEGTLTFECLGARRSFHRKRIAAAAWTVALVLSIGFALLLLWDREQVHEKEQALETQVEDFGRNLEKERSEFAFEDIDGLLAKNADENKAFITDYMADELGGGEFEVSDITAIEPFGEAYWELDGLCTVKELGSGTTYLLGLTVALSGTVTEVTSCEVAEMEPSETASPAPEEGKTAIGDGAAVESGAAVGDSGRMNQEEDMLERKDRLREQFWDALETG